MSQIFNKAGWILAGVLALVVVGVLWTTPVRGSVLPSIQRAIQTSDTHAPAPPNLINYQGRLTSGGVPVNGSKTITFSIYQQQWPAGSAIWSETQTVVVSNGLFSVELGDFTTLTGVFGSGARYLQLQVSGDPPMTPRQLFSSVPYALAADTANSADTAEVADVATTAQGIARGRFHIGCVDCGAEVTGLYASTVLGADGLPFISYYDQTNSALKVAHCDDALCFTSTRTTADNAESDGWYSSVTIGADELPVISYHDSTNLDLKVAHCNDTLCTASTKVAVDFSATSNLGYGSSITVGADLFPIISYTDATLSDLKVVHCGNVSCSAGNTITTVDPSVRPDTKTAIAIGVDGLPIIAYEDTTFVSVIHCGNLACSAGNSSQVVGASIDANPSMTVGIDGMPIVTFQRSASALWIAHCSDITCAGATVTMADNPGYDTAWSTAVTIGSDGMPVIAQHAHDSSPVVGALRVTHCSNVDCTASTTVTTDPYIYAAGLAVQTWSIVVGADGLPFIAYYDEAFQDLKVAHCTNRFCVPYTRAR